MAIAKQQVPYTYFSQSYYSDKVELKREFRALSKIYHPDLGGSDAIMAAINTEYELLKNAKSNYSTADYFNGFGKHYAKRSSKAKSAREVKYSKKDVIAMLDEWGINYFVDGVMVVADNCHGNKTYEMREELKSVGFWWDSVNKYWYWTKSHSKRKG